MLKPNQSAKGKRLIFTIIGLLFLSKLGFCSFDLVFSFPSGSGLVLSSQNDYSATVRVRVVNSEGVKYRIKQFLSQPLIAESGDSVVSDVIVSSLSFSSIPVGSIQWQAEDRLSLYERTAYLSDQTGDEVILLFSYRLAGLDLLPEGRYHTQLVLLLECEDGTRSVQRAIPINVIVEKKAPIVLKETSTKGHTLYLSGGKEGYIKIATSEGLFQVTKDGNLPNLEVQVAKDGIVLVPWRSLDEPMTVQAKGDIVVFCRQKGELLPGEYKGKLLFTTISGEVLLSVDVMLEVEEQFYLEIDKALIDLLPGWEKGRLQSNFLQIQIKNNTGRPYILVQEPIVPRFLARDKSFPVECLQVRVEKYSGQFWVEVLPWQEVKPGQMVIYTSDGKGLPVKLRVFYRIMPEKKEELLAGDYELSLTFSLLMK